MKELDATVAICTHNGSKRLKKVIKSLASQELGKHHWEILIVDNGSTDDTDKVISNLIQEFSLPIRSVREERLGITHARYRAAVESKGRIICFLDDDNPAKTNFVKNAIRFFRNEPNCGLVGGKIEPIWETEPTELVLHISRFALAICDRGEKKFRYQGQYEGPVTAGMCIRTRLLKEIYQCSNLRRKISSRIGDNLDCGEDIAFSIIAKRLGYECWYEPSIKIAHLIPKCRMEKTYLLKLYKGIGRGQAKVRKLYDWKARNPILPIFIALKDICRWVFTAIRAPQANGRIKDKQLAQDLKDLNQQLLLGRISQTFPFLK